MIWLQRKWESMHSRFWVIHWIFCFFLLKLTPMRLHSYSSFIAHQYSVFIIHRSKSGAQRFDHYYYVEHKTSQRLGAYKLLFIITKRSQESYVSRISIIIIFISERLIHVHLCTSAWSNWKIVVRHIYYSHVWSFRRIAAMHFYVSIQIQYYIQWTTETSNY